MKALEETVRGLEKDGLLWGASKLVAVGFGIKKLQINLVIEDEKVSVDDLQDEIANFEDYVQSSDVVSTHPSVRFFKKTSRVDTNYLRRLPCRSCKWWLTASFATLGTMASRRVGTLQGHNEGFNTYQKKKKMTTAG